MRLNPTLSTLPILSLAFAIGTESAYNCLSKSSPFLRPDYDDCEKIIDDLLSRKDVNDHYIFEHKPSTKHSSSYEVPETFSFKSCYVTVKLHPGMIAEMGRVRDIAETAFKLMGMCLADERSPFIGGRGDLGDGDRLVAFVHGKDTRDVGELLLDGEGGVEDLGTANVEMPGLTSRRGRR